jgi:hypothetical protein
LLFCRIEDLRIRISIVFFSILSIHHC